MSRRAIAVVLGALALVLLAAGCGAGSKRASTTAGSAATPKTPTVRTAPPATSIPSSNGSATAVLPATFIVNADGSVTPPTIGAPDSTTVLLTVISHAAAPLQVTVASTSMTVPARGRSAARVPGMKAGRYAVKIDGRRRATLVVGVKPGP